MNREVIFRGKRLDNNEWEYGDLVHDDRGGCYVYPLHCHALFVENKVDSDTVGQFTGLLDKHGKRVFEGDILKVKEYKNLCWDLSKSREERDEMMRTFALDDLKGELDKEYISAVAVEEGTYCLSSNGDYNDMYLSCLFGDMNGSLPIFDFEIIGNIHDNSELLATK